MVKQQDTAPVERLHIVDGTYELFRAYYGSGPEAIDGPELPTNAVIRIVREMLSLLRERGEAVTHLAVAFDRPIESFRNDLFEGYKTGEGMDPGLVCQMQPAEEALRALGCCVWVMDRYEADDALATAAARFRGQVRQVRLLTPDKDLGQSLRGKNADGLGEVVQVDRLRRKLIDLEALRARRGIGPESLPDWLALVGDSADGILGLRGFGEKTVSRLLAVYPHLEDIPADPADWPEGIRGAPRLAGIFAEHREDAAFYRKLATLVTEVPLQESLEALRWRGAHRQAWTAFCEAHDLAGWMDRPPAFDDEEEA